MMKVTESQVNKILVNQTDNIHEQSYMQASAYRYVQTFNKCGRYLVSKSPLNIIILGASHGWEAILLKNFYPWHYVTITDINIENRTIHRLEPLGIEIIGRCKFTDSAKLPINDSLYDMCFFNEVFEHIIADPRYVLSEVNRIIKPGGVVIFSTPNLAYIINRIRLLFGRQPQSFITRNKIGQRRNHYREWVMEELLLLFQEAGLCVENTQYLKTKSWRYYSKRNWLKMAVPFSLYSLLMSVPSFRNMIFIAARKLSIPSGDS